MPAWDRLGWGRSGGFRGNALIWLTIAHSLNASSFECRCNCCAASPANGLIVFKCIKSFKLAVRMYQADVGLFFLVFCDVRLQERCFELVEKWKYVRCWESIGCSWLIGCFDKPLMNVVHKALFAWAALFTGMRAVYSGTYRTYFHFSAKTIGALHQNRLTGQNQAQP